MSKTGFPGMRFLCGWAGSICGVLLLFSHHAAAGLKDSVDSILAMPVAPAGVVFEVASGDGDLLESAVPAIRAQAERLRTRFSDLPIAVVSHGSEQFALTLTERTERAALHDSVKVMNLADKIDVHVCGTHAGWRGFHVEDFPDYVDVTPSGPAQIRNYLELGYRLVPVHGID